MPADFVTAYIFLAALFCVAGALIVKLVKNIKRKADEWGSASSAQSYSYSHLIDYETGEVLDDDLDDDLDEKDYDIDDDVDEWPELRRAPVRKKRAPSKKPRGYQPLRKGGYTINHFAPDNFFKGKTVVFTGEISWIDRDLAACALSNLGARVTSSISSKTDIVIAGDKPGPSKMEKVDAFRAAGHDIRIMLQWEFAREVRAVFERYPGAKHSLYEIDNDFIVY